MGTSGLCTSMFLFHPEHLACTAKVTPGSQYQLRQPPSHPSFRQEEGGKAGWLKSAFPNRGIFLSA